LAPLVATAEVEDEDAEDMAAAWVFRAQQCCDPTGTVIGIAAFCS
jgi:hypothetical protein